TVLEAGNDILPHEDKDVSKTMKKSLSDKGIHFKTDIGLDESNVKVQDGSVKISLDSEVLFDKVLVAVGRSPNIDDIGMTNTKIELDNGFIKTNEYYQTKDNHIYAVGDCIGNLDRKSTRLNSSHVSISYAVFCLKKK